MAVFRDFEIEWNGEIYKVKPSMALLRTIEGQGVSVMHVTYMASSGRPQASHMAPIVGTVMRSAGAKVTDEELCAEFMVGDDLKVWALWNSVLEAISPTAPAEKKPEAPDEAPQ